MEQILKRKKIHKETPPELWATCTCAGWLNCVAIATEGCNCINEEGQTSCALLKNNFRLTRVKEDHMQWKLIQNLNKMVVNGTVM